MTRLKRNTILLIAFLLLSSIARSESSSLGSHEHGKAELTIAIEDGRVEIQLISPAANIIGFEHTPANDEQKRHILYTGEILSSAGKLFEFEGAICQPVGQTLDLPFSDEHSEAEHAHDEHEEEEDHDEEHQHSDEHNEEHDDGHVEIVASYSFECGGRGPTSLRALILDQFPAIESLHTQWITSTKQGTKELTQSQPSVDF